MDIGRAPEGSNVIDVRQAHWELSMTKVALEARAQLDPKLIRRISVGDNGGRAADCVVSVFDV